jgi:protein phosphatase
VVTEQTLHKTLMTFADPEEAVGQLIDLAIRSGGPDNITCIVADVVDTVTGPVAPSAAAVLAGAAAHNETLPQPRSDSPAGRAHLLTRDAPQLTRPAPGSASSSNGYHDDDDYDEDDDGDDTGRRRWPVVSSILVILVLLIAGGGYTAWHISQGQYFVGSASGQVIIYRGVNEKVAGLTLSSAFVHTGIPVSHLSSGVLTLPTSSGSLAEAQRTVQNIRRGYACQQAVTAVAKWQAGKPKPPVIKKGRKPTRAQRKAAAAVAAYPAKPPVPAYCPAQGTG